MMESNKVDLTTYYTNLDCIVEIAERSNVKQYVIVPPELVFEAIKKTKDNPNLGVIIDWVKESTDKLGVGSIQGGK